MYIKQNDNTPNERVVDYFCWYVIRADSTCLSGIDNMDDYAQQMWWWMNMMKTLCETKIHFIFTTLAYP